MLNRIEMINELISVISKAVEVDNLDEIVIMHICGICVSKFSDQEEQELMSALLYFSEVDKVNRENWTITFKTSMNIHDDVKPLIDLLRINKLSAYGQFVKAYDVHKSDEPSKELLCIEVLANDLYNDELTVCVDQDGYIVKHFGGDFRHGLVSVISYNEIEEDVICNLVKAASIIISSGALVLLKDVR